MATSKRRLRLSLRRDPTLTATAVGVTADKLVYLLVADKRLMYPSGKSKIVYIGTTRNGIARVAQSVAARADTILSQWGVRGFVARIVTCRPRQRVKTWHKLERALLLEFRATYGDVPLCNQKGTRMRETDEFRYFTRKAVRNVIRDLS